MNLKKREPDAVKQRPRRPHGAAHAAPKAAVSTRHELDVRHDEIEPMATDIALFRKLGNPAVGGAPVADDQHIHAADEPLGILLRPRAAP